MNLTRGAVARPVLTSVVCLIVVALGAISYTRLSIDLMPEVTYPTISVVTTYSDVGPQEMEQLVTIPLEESLAAVQGVEELTSTSVEGRSVVRAEVSRINLDFPQLKVSPIVDTSVYIRRSIGNTGSALLVGFALALFLVYMVMAWQFESCRDPFIVLFSIPMALIGITGTMLVSRTVFSIQAFIGCIMLAGIVVNNAILLVDYTNQLRRRDGLPLARVVIGGLTSSTLVTLVLVPVVYSLFAGTGRRGEAR